MSEEHVILHVELDRDFILRGQTNESICTRLVLQTSDEFASRFPKSDCHVLLLLDTSSSMDGAFAKEQEHLSKRQGIEQAIQAMVDELQPEDRVSLAFFDSRAYPIAQALTGRQRREILEAVDQLSQYSGATNFEAAFGVACQWAENASQPSRRIVFLTDGNETTGNWQRALEQAQELSQQGITIDCLGVGGDFAFDRMQELSQPSGGTTRLLDTPQSAKLNFREILHNAQRALVHDVLLRLRLPPERRNIELYQMVPEIRPYTPTPDSTGWTHHTVRVGDLYHHQVASLLVNFALDTDVTTPSLELFHLRLDYSIPRLGLPTAFHEEIVRVNLTDQAHREVRDTSISLEYTEASLSLDEQDFRRVYQSDWQQAAKILEQMYQKAQRIGLSDKAALYEANRQQLMTHHQITQEQLNHLFARTSRSTRARTQPQRQNTTKPIF